MKFVANVKLYTVCRRCCIKQATTEPPSLADDVRFHPSLPNDVMLSTCRRQHRQLAGGRGCLSQRGASTMKAGNITASVRPFVCPSCLAGFSNRATLVRHTRVHTGQRPYRCPVCSRAFTQSGNLTRHLRAKHSQPVVIGNADKHPLPTSATSVVTSSPLYAQVLSSSLSA